MMMQCDACCFSFLFISRRESWRCRLINSCSTNQLTGCTHTCQQINRLTGVTPLRLVCSSLANGAICCLFNLSTNQVGGRGHADEIDQLLFPQSACRMYTTFQQPMGQQEVMVVCVQISKRSPGIFTERRLVFAIRWSQ